MNHRTWILAVGGTISLGSLMAFAGESDWTTAEDELLPMREVAPPVPEDGPPVRSSKAVEPQSSPPNYYDKLFTDDLLSPAKKKKGPLPASAPKRDVIDPELQPPAK